MTATAASILEQFRKAEPGDRKIVLEELFPNFSTIHAPESWPAYWQHNLVRPDEQPPLLTPDEEREIEYQLSRSQDHLTANELLARIQS